MPVLLMLGMLLGNLNEQSKTHFCSHALQRGKVYDIATHEGVLEENVILLSE